MEIEFIVGDEPYNKDGHWHAPGRCITDVAVGDSFKKMIRYTSAYDKDKCDWEMSYSDPIEINLTIERIISYRREWHSLSSGMTALLVFSGPDTPALENHVVLRGEAPNSKDTHASESSDAAAITSSD